jgi:hypothetical protein
MSEVKHAFPTQAEKHMANHCSLLSDIVRSRRGRRVEFFRGRRELLLLRPWLASFVWATQVEHNNMFCAISSNDLKRMVSHFLLYVPQESCCVLMIDVFMLHLA